MSPLSGPGIFDVPAPDQIDSLHPLLSTTQSIDGIVVHRGIYYATYPTAKFPSPGIRSGPCSPSDEPSKFKPCLGLWSYSTFAIDSLVFLVAYRASIAGPELIADECMNFALFEGENWQWGHRSYEWHRSGYSFTLTEKYAPRRRLFRIDISAFIDNSDQLLKAVFYTLAKQ